MRRLQSLTLAGLLLFSITGCVVKAPQLDTVRAVVVAFTNSEEKSELSAPKWTAKIGDQGRIVDVYEDKGLHIFISDTGDAVAFDGWHVRSLIGFGDETVRQIVVDSNQMQFISVRQSVIVRCDPWESSSGTSSGIVWQQRCEKSHRPNRIVVNADGAIIEIEQTVTASQRRILLRRL